MKKSIKEFCEKHNITEDQFYGRATVGGYLYLRSVTSLPDGFNPTVGGYLDLGSVTSLPDGFNPTVGGDLYLGSVTSLPDGFNPTVGGYLFTKNSRKKIGANVERPKINKNFFWKKNKTYARIDGIFCEILIEKESKGYAIYSAKKVNKEEYFFIANKDSFCAHGKDLKTAIKDLEFKIVAEKLKKEPIKKDTVFSIMYYRTLTGACEMGCKSWMQSNNIPLTDKEGNETTIKAVDLLPLLKKSNAYGYDKFKSLITF